MEEKDKSIDKSIDERVHQQLVYKDNRIIDLNNVILDKERQILDLQERVREHNEVASVKNQAMRIVQQKFEELHKDKKDMSTETEPGLMAYSAQGPSTSGSSKPERRTRSSSPGHVIAARKSTSFPSSGTFSPPPVDPPVESASTSKLGANLPDIDGIHRKHQRKRVTFDLNPNAPRLVAPSAPESLESALTEASSENALLRQQVFDLNAAVEKMKADYEAEIVKCTKEAKTAGLKAKVAATARIKELEATLEGINQKYEDENDCLREEVATLRSSRNWEIEQNGQLREQIAHLKEKSHKLNEELDASEKARRELDKEVDEAKAQIELMVDDLLQAEHVVNFHVNQKEAIFQDVDRLKDAINAQDRFIEILEADIVIYEQHIGLLRENLGASKIDHRALIKSKAFETKLHALEREKEQSDKKSSEDRLKTKALDKKCRVLVEQNEQLMARLCELEMKSSSSHHPSAASSGSSTEQQLAEHAEHIRQITLALESERDVSQKLREAKESAERELMTVRRQEEASQNRAKHDVEMSRMEAQNKVEEMTVEVEAAHKKISDVMAELEQLRATNFDLQMHIETAKRTMEELANSNEELEDRVKEVEEECEEKTDDLKQSTWDVEQLTRQNEALRVELDGIRQGFQETRELSDEVRQLKAELAKQQELHRAHFDAECERLAQEELGNVPERKTSLEVQQEQYILAFELKVAQLTKELEETKAQREQLQAQLESAAPVQRKTTSVLEAPNLEQIVKQEVQMTSAEAPTASESAELQNLRQQNISLLEDLQKLSSGPPKEAPELEQLRQQNQVLIDKLQRSEMEATLSGELNVELGRAMLELEEQNELLKKNQQTVSQDEVASGRELELHVMMVNEMTDQIAILQARIDDIQAKKEAQTEELNKWRTEAASATHENHRLTGEVQRLLHNLSEFEIARKEDVEQLNFAHDAEIREFSIKMEDARRDIADLEARLQESTQKLMRSEQKASEVVVQETQILSSSTPVSEAPDSSESPPQALQDVPVDISMLIELKEELQIAVEALKAEIWSLNGQLKASILDREGLEDKLAETDSLLEKEKKRAIGLDVELQEQVDLTERAVRRAAEAENESNQRMAECLEKETRREEIEKAYTRLNEYYQQLQEAYNNVYAQLAAAQAQSSSDAPAIAPELNATSSESLALSPIVDGIMTILLISRDPSISLSTQQKLEKIGEKLKSLLSEFDENQKALEEQRRISEALEARLHTLEIEHSRASASGEVTTTRERVEQLEGEIEWKEEECEGLKRRIRELEKALEAVAERADESEAAAVSRLSTELAILAARLTTRQADVDSLFRTNAELAHTNVRLQNEIDDAEEWKAKVDEEKQQLEANVKQLEEQVAELMQQHEEHLQRAQQVQMIPDHSAELQETQQEVQRLVLIEKTLNNRILALEDQNMELEEKVQEIEEELMEVKNQAASSEHQKPAKTSSDDWDSWDNDEQTQVPEDSEEVKALTMRVEMLQMQNEQLQSQMKHEKQQKKTVPEVKPEEEEDDWGWGDEKQETSQSQKTTTTAVASQNLELIHAKSEIERLGSIEKVLNNRILALEDQNLELEERLQEMEEELSEEKKKKKEEEKTEDDWGGWNEEEKKEDVNEDGHLQKTISELQERLKFQKEVIEKVEMELIDQQEKYDELEEQFQKAQAALKDAERPNESEQLTEQLRALEAQFTAARQERDDLRQILSQKEDELKALEERVKELEEDKEKADGWNEEGWEADSEDKNEEIEQLKQKNDELERELDEERERIRSLEKAKDRAESKLNAATLELEDVKKTLAQKEAELAEAESSSSAWNDDEWKDDTEAEKLKQEKKLLEMQVDALRNELQVVREREQELSELNEQLKRHLELSVRELGEAKQALAASGSGGWSDQGWNEGADEEKTILELELQKKNEVIDELREQIIELQREALEASEAADLKTLEELLKMREQLRVVQEQNGLLKDSEARLMDHADEFAEQMEQYREKCTVSTSRIAELEKKLASASTEEQQLKLYSDELVTLRQQLANAEQEKRIRNATISDREGLILELRRQVAEHAKTIEELQLKVKHLATARRAQATAGTSSRPKAPSTSQSSRPPSQMSTSSRLSTSSSFVPEAVAVPIQSIGSAFDVVVPQSSGEPLRRRNK